MCTVSGIKYIKYTIVQPTPPSISRSFSFSQTETLYLLNTNSPSLPAPGNHHSTVCLHEFDSSQYFI